MKANKTHCEGCEKRFKPDEERTMIVFPILHSKIYGLPAYVCAHKGCADKVGAVLQEKYGYPAEERGAA